MLTLSLTAPIYDHRCDSRRDDFLSALCYYLGRHVPDVSIGPVWHKHATHIQVGRNYGMKAAVDGGADVALCLDADTWLPLDQIPATARQIVVSGSHRADCPRPIVAFPTEDRDGRPNVWGIDGHRVASWRKVPRGGVVGGVGSAAWILDIDWYRRYWPAAPWFAVATDGGCEVISEDRIHCAEIIKRGGVIWCSSIRAIHRGHA